METNVVFNGFDLQTANIFSSEIRHEGLPAKDAQAYALAHANKSALPFINYPSKTITIEGKLVSTTGIAGLDALLDTFKAYFNTKEGNLDIDYNGGTRRYIATLADMDVDRPGGLAFANFTLTFICTQPFGQNTTNTTANSDLNQTAATDSWTHTYLGTAPIQLPVITISFDSITGGANYLRVYNNANGQGIMIIDHTFAAADVLVIDTKERTVKINGIEVDFLGTFPELAPGSQTLAYQDGFTARQIDVTITYNPLWL